MENQEEPQNPNVDAEQQMETLAEGKVADAVQKTNARDKPRKDDLEIQDFTSDLDR